MSKSSSDYNTTPNLNTVVFQSTNQAFLKPDGKIIILNRRDK